MNWNDPFGFWSIGAVLAHKNKEKQVKKKRLYFHEIRQFDLDHDESYIRSLEMTVDGLCGCGHPQVGQFFKDVMVYGLQEAVLYLENAGYVVTELRKEANEIEQVIRDFEKLEKQEK